jgi:hypothetical protein
VAAILQMDRSLRRELIRLEEQSSPDSMSTFFNSDRQVVVLPLLAVKSKWILGNVG